VFTRLLEATVLVTEYGDY